MHDLVVRVRRRIPTEFLQQGRRHRRKDKGKRKLAEIYSNDYALNVNTGIIYNKSAFKHGLTEADIEWAFLHPIRNGLLEDYENKYLLIGFDTRGNPVEVVYNRIDEERVNVFHAMKCRRGFLPHDMHNLV